MFSSLSIINNRTRLRVRARKGTRDDPARRTLHLGRVVLAVDDVQLHLARRAARLDATAHLARLGPDDLVEVQPQPVVVPLGQG